MDEYKMPEDVEVSVRVSKLESKSTVLTCLCVGLVVVLAVMAVVLTMVAAQKSNLVDTITTMQSDLQAANARIQSLENAPADAAAEIESDNDAILYRLERVEERVKTAEKSASATLEAVGNLNKKVTAHESEYNELYRYLGLHIKDFENHIDDFKTFAVATKDLFVALGELHGIEF